MFPYPVTRDRDQNRRLDLTKESRPYQYGLVGHAAPGSSPSPSHDGRPDSATGLIGASGVGLTPMASASGNIATIHGTLGAALPVGAAPPDRYSHSGGSVSGASSSTAPLASNQRAPLQVINSPSPPGSPQSGFSPGAVPGPIPLAAHESWSEKAHVRGPSLSSAGALSNDGQFQGPSGSGRGEAPEGTPAARPESIPITGDPTDAPPAYVA